jgi:hypothetical protein
VNSREPKRTPVAIRTAPFWLGPLLALGSTLAANPQLIDRQVERQPVEYGVELISIRQFDSHGWLNICALEADLSLAHLSLDALLGHEGLTSPEHLTQITQRRNAIAGVNGDFFYIRTTNAPLGVHLQSGELVKSPAPGRDLSAGFAEGVHPLFIGRVAFRGSMSLQDGRFQQELTGWNIPAPPADGIALYTPRWGETAQGTGSADLAGATGLVHILVDHEGTVLEALREHAGPGIPENGAVLLGRGEGANWLLAHAQPGASLRIQFDLTPPHLQAAIGGGPLLLKEGQVMPDPGGDIHPRTAIGIDRDRSRAWLVVVDGRSPLSRGMTLHELALLLRELGAHHALNLDGGGSSTLVARTPGLSHASLKNVPSDGGERLVPNGLGIFSSSTPGPMSQLFFHPPEPNGAYALNQTELRLAPGGVYRPVVQATDQHIHLLELPLRDLHWQVEPPHLGSFTEDGLFLPEKPGIGILRATLESPGRPLEATLPVRIIGLPIQLEISPSELSLSPGQRVDLQVEAVDARGYRAPLAAEDISWEVRGDVGSVEAGQFVAADRAASGAVVATFQDLTSLAPIGIGEKPVSLSTFEDITRWSSHSVPEETTAELSVVDHKPYTREHAKTVRLSYRFEGTTRTRAAYLRPQGGPLPLPGRPLRLGLWAFGDGKEAWLRGQIADAAGVARAIDFAPRIDWTGWRYLEAEIPPGTDYPIALRSIYVVETRPDAQYRGEIHFDELLAVHAPDIDPSHIEDRPLLPDPANRSQPAIDRESGHFRFVVFGDSKLEASAPDSAGARVLQALIDRINREDIDFTLYTGDLVENDSEANYQYGREMLDRLAKPNYMAIANHEIAGTNSFERYTEFFGPTFYHFSHGGADFIVLNTARPAGLRASEPAQWIWFREKLKEIDAEKLFIMTHTPLVDPLPGGKTGWTDPAEIDLFQRVLAEQVEAGRSVYVFHGHVHGFHRRIYDGVQYLTSAGAGSDLYLPPGRGGFFHYVIVTVKDGDISYQVVPLLEAIDLPEVITLRVGEALPLEATGIAPEGLVKFPLRYPATVEYILKDPRVASYEPATGILSGLHPGDTRLEVWAGGISAFATLRVTD